MCRLRLDHQGNDPQEGGMMRSCEVVRLRNGEAGIECFQGFLNPGSQPPRGQTLLGDVVFFNLALKLWSAD